MNSFLERRVARLESNKRAMPLGQVVRVIVQDGQDDAPQIAAAQRDGAALVIVRKIVSAGRVAAC